MVPGRSDRKVLSATTFPVPVPELGPGLTTGGVNTITSTIGIGSTSCKGKGLEKRSVGAVLGTSDTHRGGIDACCKESLRPVVRC
jgi:hypothetical protein